MKEDLAFFLTSGGHTVKIGLRGKQLRFDDLCLIRQQFQLASLFGLAVYRDALDALGSVAGGG